MSAPDPEDRALVVRPIGVLRTPFQERAEAPRQPRAAEGAEGTIELFPGHGYEDALLDLASWERIWVVTWFDRNEGWRPKVRPPRSDRKRGVFATRSPHRPNPLGLSVLRLDAVEGLVLRVRDVDLLDGTPVLDIKPYVAWTDAVPDAGGGWLETDPSGPRGDRPEDPRGQWRVSFTEAAEAQLAWLEARGVALRGRVEEALAHGPKPHAYRRIKVVDGRHRLAVKDWRALFDVDEVAGALTVTRLASGYARKALDTDDPALATHRAFRDAFGG